MGLSLGVKVGDSVFVGDHVIDVREITQDRIYLKCDGRIYDITGHEYTAVAQEVRIRRGNWPGSSNSYPKLDIEASKQVKISLYRRDRSVNLQRRLLHLCEMVARGHEWPWRTLQRLCAKSPRACRALEAILADPRAPRFGDDWTSRFKYLVASPRPVQGGLPGLGRRN